MEHVYVGNEPMFYPMFPEVGNIEAKPGDVVDFPEDAVVPFNWIPVTGGDDESPPTPPKTKTKREPE